MPGTYGPEVQSYCYFSGVDIVILPDTLPRLRPRTRWLFSADKNRRPDGRKFSRNVTAAPAESIFFGDKNYRTINVRARARACMYRVIHLTAVKCIGNAISISILIRDIRKKGGEVKNRIFEKYHCDQCVV